jgi:hypothetical protein
MIKALQLSWFALVMAASAILIIFGSYPFRISRLFTILVITSVLVVALAVQTRSYFGHRPTSNVMRWITLEGGVLFLGGAAYGVARSLREPWHWLNLYFVFPTAIGFYFLWITFKLWRNDN